MVVLHHAYNRATADHSGAMGHIFATGAAGVHIFFVISGFVMMHVALNDRGECFDAGGFIKRRLIRIYPIYWIFCALTIAAAALIVPGYKSSEHVSLGAALLLPGYGILNQGWTLTFEVYFYLLFAVFWKAGRLWGMCALSAIFLACVAVGFAIKPTNPMALLVTSPLLLEFIAGIWVAYLLSKPCPKWLAHAFWAGLAGWLITFTIDEPRIPSLIMWGAPSVLMIAGIIRAEQLGMVPEWVLSRARLGDASYALYLSHILIIDLIIATVWRPVDSLAVTLVFCFACLAVCAATSVWVYARIEKPILKVLRSRILPENKALAAA